ncbi:hypothetical protein LTI14_11140 [Nesterenkonia sp. YGD6]|uniref:hypothetical protein n=1 Tax=Nesterenkonia sp. YGD6 TaxID=2901231 RepID=UPI001F4D34EC|nr:hypothetical protein [Nesterenkonia sp. YGD6]MCH8563761.1 hypothetical protein [Nesterenkonia sp. YGD6]
MDRYDEAARHLIDVGVGRTNFTNIVVAAEALDRGITVRRATSSSRMVLEHQGRMRTWAGGSTNHNDDLLKKIASYKDVASRLFRDLKISAPENAVFGVSESARAWAWASPFTRSVIKPHNGRQGQNVHAGIATEDEFHTAFHRVAAVSSQILVEEFYTGVEHRCLVVEGSLVAATQRRPASVLGDGRTSISDLVRAKNRDRGPIHKDLVIDSVAREYLDRHGYRPDTVPRAAERVYLRSTSNLHTGGDAVDATDEIRDEERELVERAARALRGLRIVGFDVLLPRGDGDVHAASVLEINASPMVSMHHFPWSGEPRDAARHVVDSLFPRTVRR